MLISFLNDEDIQLILEFKISFGKYHPIFPKKGRFLGHLVVILVALCIIAFLSTFINGLECILRKVSKKRKNNKIKRYGNYVVQL